MSAWVLDFQGLGEGEEVDEKGIGGEKGRNEALMKACDGCGTSENWPLQLPHRHVVVVHHRSRKRKTQKYLDHLASTYSDRLDLTSFILPSSDAPTPDLPTLLRSHPATRILRST